MSEQRAWALYPGKEKSMNLVNLTPHKITILTQGATVEVPPSGQVARIASTKAPVEVEGCPVPLSTVRWGAPEGVPEEQPGTLLIVSALVREALPHRQDLASPGDLVRDESGQPTGCKGLIVNAR